MANGWLPQTGEQWMRWQEQRMRIQERHRHSNYLQDWPEAIDASIAPATIPQGTYIEGAEEDYEIPLFPEGEFIPTDIVETGGF